MEKSEKKPMNKVDRIMQSKMPQAQKEACLQELAPQKVSEPKMPFEVWAKVKKLDKSLLAPMKAYPNARVVKMATSEEWDRIFKDF